jgi:hypothetical protein
MSTNAPRPDAASGTPANRAPERRKRDIPVVRDRRSKIRMPPPAEESERIKPERRRMVDPTTCEREYSEDEIMFMKAMDQYKRDNRRPFPTWSEVLEVLLALGYRKVAEPTSLPGLCSQQPPPKG